MPNVPIAISASLNVDDVSVLVRSTETVSDTASRMDQGIGLLIVDLAAQASDIDVDDIGRGIEMQVPDVLQKHRPRDDAARVAHQIFQQLELLRQKLDILAVPARGSRDQVDREIADAQDGFLGDGVAAPAKRLEPREEFDERERLDQIIVTAGAQAAHPVVDLSKRADDQERRGNAVVAQLTHHRDAIDVRKHAVDRDDRIVAGRAAAQRFVAVGGQIHLVTAGRELVHELTGGLRVILNDQNAAMTSRHGLQSPNQPPVPIQPYSSEIHTSCGTCGRANPRDGRHRARGNAAAATVTSGRLITVAVVPTHIDQPPAISGPHALPAAVVVAVIGGVSEGHANEGEAIEAMTEEAGVEKAVVESTAGEARCECRSREGRACKTGACETRARTDKTRASADGGKPRTSAHAAKAHAAAHAASAHAPAEPTGMHTATEPTAMHAAAETTS